LPGEELVSEVQERDARGPSAQRQPEGAAVEPDGSVEVSNLDGHVVDADRTVRGHAGILPPPGYPAGVEGGLSHLDDSGRARMVDVSAKDATDRRAVARAEVTMSAATAALVATGDAPKGDVAATARIAGIQAAKRTAELIPLCHPLPLTYVDVAVEVGETTVTLTGEARTRAETGVEMEAMTACAVAALTVYDMVKGVERGVEVGPVVLLEKSGGKEDWRRGG
jgi:cyclic pyranopterin phosphate synthase